MNKDRIRGLDELRVGDILLHDHDDKTREYLVTMKFPKRVSLSSRRLGATSWVPCGIHDDSNGLFTRYMYFKNREIPYDPTQQGDTDEDI